MMRLIGRLRLLERTCVPSERFLTIFRLKNDQISDPYSIISLDPGICGEPIGLFF